MFAISGIIANQCSQINTQPVFHYKRDIEKLADLVEEKHYFFDFSSSFITEAAFTPSVALLMIPPA